MRKFSTLFSKAASPILRQASFFERRRKEKEEEAAYRNMMVQFHSGEEPSSETQKAMQEILLGIRKAQIESFENKNIFKLVESSKKYIRGIIGLIVWIGAVRPIDLVDISIGHYVGSVSKILLCV